MSRKTEFVKIGQQERAGRTTEAGELLIYDEILLQKAQIGVLVFPLQGSA